MAEIELCLLGGVQGELDGITEQEVEATRLELPEYGGGNDLLIGEAPEIIRKLFAFHRKNRLIFQDVSVTTSLREDAYAKVVLADIVIRAELMRIFQGIKGEGSLLPTRDWKLYCISGPNPFAPANEQGQKH